MPPRLRRRLWYLNKRVTLWPCRRPGAVVASFRQLSGDAAAVSRYRFLTHHEVTFGVNVGLALAPFCNMGIYCVGRVYAAVAPVPGFGPDTCNPGQSVFLWGFTLLPAAMSLALVYLSPKLEPRQLHDAFLLPLVVAAYTCTQVAPAVGVDGSSVGGSSSGAASNAAGAQQAGLRSGSRLTVYASPLRPPLPTTQAMTTAGALQSSLKAAAAATAPATTTAPAGAAGGAHPRGVAGNAITSSSGSINDSSSGRGRSSFASGSRRASARPSAPPPLPREGPWQMPPRQSRLSLLALWQAVAGGSSSDSAAGGDYGPKSPESAAAAAADDRDAAELERVLGAFTVHFVTGAPGRGRPPAPGTREGSAGRRRPLPAGGRRPRRRAGDWPGRRRVDAAGAGCGWRRCQAHAPVRLLPGQRRGRRGPV